MSDFGDAAAASLDEELLSTVPTPNLCPRTTGRYVVRDGETVPVGRCWSWRCASCADRRLARLYAQFVAGIDRAHADGRCSYLATVTAAGRNPAPAHALGIVARLAEALRRGRSRRAVHYSALVHVGARGHLHAHVVLLADLELDRSRVRQLASRAGAGFLDLRRIGDRAEDAHAVARYLVGGLRISRERLTRHAPPGTRFVARSRTWPMTARSDAEQAAFDRAERDASEAIVAHLIVSDDGSPRRRFLASIADAAPAGSRRRMVAMIAVALADHRGDDPQLLDLATAPLLAEAKRAFVLIDKGADHLDRQLAKRFPGQPASTIWTLVCTGPLVSAEPWREVWEDRRREYVMAHERSGRPDIPEQVLNDFPTFSFLPVLDTDGDSSYV